MLSCSSCTCLFGPRDNACLPVPLCVLCAQFVGHGVVGGTQARFLSVHEHHSWNLLRKVGIPTPRGTVARSAEEALQIARDLGRKPCRVILC